MRRSTIEPQQLKVFILDAGLISSQDLNAVEEKAKKTGESLEDVLIKEGKITEENLTRLQSYILGIPFVNLEGEKIDYAVLSLIPELIARKNNIIAFKKLEGNLEVAMLDPGDLVTIDFIKKKLGLKILPRLTDKASMRNILQQYQKSLKAEFGDIIQKEAVGLKVLETDAGEEVSGDDLKKMAEDVPIIRIVETLLKHAIVQRASDIHIEPLEKEMVVRYRIDGILHDAMVLPKNVATGIIARIKVLANLKIDEKRLPQDGRFKIEAEDERVAFRVSILPVYNGEKAVLRLLHETSKTYSLERLGFFPDQVDIVHTVIRRSTGMILVTGPTGSGKTTTLYTVLDILNTPDVNISTVEDPIEYQMPRINQTQVKPEIGMTFANGLRALLRQDPNIIMVGEIRDTETAALAINAALTGHLVLSTLHTNSAAGSVARLLDMKVEPFLLASTVNIIMAQRLVRMLHAGKEKYFLSKEELEHLSKSVDLDRMLDLIRKEKIVDPKDGWDKVPFYKPKKSVEAPDGYMDRIGIHEILEVTEPVRKLIIASATSEEIENMAKQTGMYTMFEDGIMKAAQGITTIEEVMRVTSNE